MLGVSDKYEAFCIDEAAEYLYIEHTKRIREEAEFKKSMEKHSVKKRK